MTRRRWWVLATFMFVAWAAVAAFLLVRAALDLQAGREKAQEARDQLDAAAIADGTALPDLRDARDRFRRAADATGSPLLVPVKLLPVLGRQVRSVHALAGAAETVTDAGTDALEQARLTLTRGADGPGERLTQVRELTEAVTAASKRVRAVDDLGPRTGLVGPVRNAHNELATKLAEVRRTLDDAAAGATAGLRLLTGPRRYLLVAANPAEMRAGSGMWLSGGLLRTEGGSFDVSEMAPLYEQADPLNGAVPIGDRDVADRWEEIWHPNWDWRGLMTSPRLPASAELGRRMWAAAGQPEVDGVLVVNPVALAAVVRATGPVQAQGRTVTADQVVPLLMNGQYQQLSGGATNADRREGLAALSTAAFEALDQQEWSPATLAEALADALRGRHLMAWSADGDEQRGWEAAGLAGELGPDSLLVSVLNRGGNKLDWFLRARAELTTVRARGGRDVTVRLRLANGLPDGQPRYVTGPPTGAPWEAGLYLGVVAVNVPGAATDVTIEGAPPVTSGRDGPTHVVAAEVRIPRGRSTELVVRFHLPGRHGRIVVEPSARVPATRWQHGASSWEDSRQWTAKF